MAVIGSNGRRRESRGMFDGVTICWSPGRSDHAVEGPIAVVETRGADTSIFRCRYAHCRSIPRKPPRDLKQILEKVDNTFARRAQWIQRRAADIPVCRRLAELLSPALMGTAGSLHLSQATAVAGFAKPYAAQQMLLRTLPGLPAGRRCCRVTRRISRRVHKRALGVN
jgi:hypothetical protein